MTIKVRGQTLKVEAIIERERPQQCDFCGEIAELRPYGPKGEAVCFKCSMQDPEAAERGFRKLTGL